LPGPEQEEETWWPNDDESIHQMGLMLRAAFKLADLHDKTVEEVMNHVTERWQGLVSFD